MFGHDIEKTIITSQWSRMYTVYDQLNQKIVTNFTLATRWQLHPWSTLPVSLWFSG